MITSTIVAMGEDTAFDVEKLSQYITWCISFQIRYTLIQNHSTLIPDSNFKT